MTELLRCPFCGCGAELTQARYTDSDVIDWQVFCTSCGNSTMETTERHQAVKSWNKRVEVDE